MELKGVYKRKAAHKSQPSLTRQISLKRPIKTYSCTGILFWAVMGKKLSSLQWSALILLAIGCAISQNKTSCDTTHDSGVKTSAMGVILCVIVSLMSPTAGIATGEKCQSDTRPLNIHISLKFHRNLAEISQNGS